MSAQVPNPDTRALTSVPYRASLATHPDYTYWAEHWEVIRDCEVGEVEIKRKQEKYLPKPVSLDKLQYSSYLRRAVFFNMVSRTLHALYGTVFRRTPKVSGLTPKLQEATKRITKEATSLHLLAKTAVKEVLAVGRYGLLIDASREPGSAPYVACYTAENILDWEMEEVNGRMQLTRVVLREIYYDRTEPWAPYNYKSRYRVLALEESAAGWVYSQYIFDQEDAFGVRVPDTDAAPDEVVTPEVRGRTLDYIPFIVIGPFTNHPDVAKPPILDIVTLNLSHYLSYATLEQARYYTGTPIFTVHADTEGPSEYTIGPETVWKMGKEEKASILEFNGTGLRSLESALSEKEAQISAIGGRMMPGSSRGTAESDNALLLKERNEQTLLLNIADTVDEALTQILRWWADWSNAPGSAVRSIKFGLNRDFLIKDIGAREFRAIHQMYADGIIPVDVVFSYLSNADVVPDWMDKEDFVKRLEDAKQFPNMVDVLARMKDFPDAKAYHEFEMQKQTMAQATNVQPGQNDPESVGMPEQVRDQRAAAAQKSSAEQDPTNG